MLVEAHIRFAAGNAQSRLNILPRRDFSELVWCHRIITPKKRLPVGSLYDKLIVIVRD